MRRPAVPANTFPREDATMARRHSRRRTGAAKVPILIAVAWYDAAQWARLKQVAEDPDELDDTYEEWQQGAEYIEREFMGRGLEVRRVPIDVDALVAWCRQHNKPVVADSRVEYTTEIARGGRSSAQGFRA
jgi:hypothetical protein